MISFSPNLQNWLVQAGQHRAGAPQRRAWQRGGAGEAAGDVGGGLRLGLGHESVPGDQGGTAHLYRDTPPGHLSCKEVKMYSILICQVKHSLPGVCDTRGWSWWPPRLSLTTGLTRSSPSVTSGGCLWSNLRGLGALRPQDSCAGAQGFPDLRDVFAEAAENLDAILISAQGWESVLLDDCLSAPPLSG